jgi:hypothetical protein
VRSQPAFGPDPLFAAMRRDVGNRGKGGQSVDAADIYQKVEIEKWWPIIKAANIRAE